MNNSSQPADGDSSCLLDTATDLLPASPVLGGFEGSNPFYKEPSLYLSILVVLIAAAVYLSKTPLLFLTSSAALTAVVVLLHYLAERFLNPAKQETFSQPLGGMMVITFGAMLPGLGLLAYAVHAMFTGAKVSLLDELGKLSLLLLVPLLNFSVWCAVKRGYLARPRLAALMNGLALGLSLSWSILWVAALCIPGGANCRFGWMLLLSVSPLMLASAAWLNYDLCRRTAGKIARLTKVFSLLGAFVSVVFVFAPLAKAYYLQNLIDEARRHVADTDGNNAAVKALREAASAEDLLPQLLGGMNLAEMLLPQRGLNVASIGDRVLYFKVTGRTLDHKNDSVQPVLGKLGGLSLRSNIDGTVDATGLAAALNWTMTFHNASRMAYVALAEIAVPPGTTITRAVLTTSNQDAVLVPVAQNADDDNKARLRSGDKLILTRSGPDRYLLQINSVPQNGGETQIRLSLSEPLATIDGRAALMKMPYFSQANFSVSRRLRLSVKSTAKLISDKKGTSRIRAEHKDGEVGLSLSGLLKTDQEGQGELCFSRNSASDIIIADDGKRLIEERLVTNRTFAPRRLYVVVDGSATIPDLSELKESALGAVPCTIRTVGDAHGDASKVEKFGLDNYAELKATLEDAAEQEGSAVIWIHGPQVSDVSPESEPVLDLVNAVHLYDLQIVPGENNVLPTIRAEDSHHQLVVASVPHATLASDLRGLLGDWRNRAVTVTLERREIEKGKIPAALMANVISGDVGRAIGNIWAADEANPAPAPRNPFVTADNGFVAFGEVREQTAAINNPEAFMVPMVSFAGYQLSSTSVPSYAGGLVGAPADPRYGQSNVVGQLADFGYDCARDMSRLLTIFSALAAVVLAFYSLRLRRRRCDFKTVAMAAAVPLAVHLIGTFVVNNFGGLGGGL